MSLSPDIISSVVSKYFAATRAMDPDAWVDCFAEDATSHDPYGGAEKHGHEQLRQFFRGICAGFDKVGLTEDSIFVAGDRAAVKFTGRGTGKNGRSVLFEGIDVFQIGASGKIQTMWGYWNPAAMLAELNREGPS